MYLQFYHLRKAPFQMAADPDFFWAGENYRKALDVLRYGLEHQGGLSLLIGDAGVGKTAAVQALLHSLDEHVVAATIPDPCLTAEDFYRLVSHALGKGDTVNSQQEFHRYLEALLHKSGQEGRQVLLVIDEAQQLTPEVIREIDAMIDLPAGAAGGLSICLVGRINDARDLMARIADTFTNRITVTYCLSPLSRKETLEYIRHRIRVAGSDGEIFARDALQEIHRYSEGHPGLINVLCDFVLFSACNAREQEVTAEMIQAGAATLRLAERMEIDEAADPREQSLQAATDADETAEADREEEPELAARVDTDYQQKRVVVTAPDESDDQVRSISADMPAGRSLALSVGGAVVAVVLLAGGYLYYLNRDRTELLLPTEPPAAGHPVAGIQTAESEQPALPAQAVVAQEPGSEAVEEAGTPPESPGTDQVTEQEAIPGESAVEEPSSPSGGTLLPAGHPAETGSDRKKVERHLSPELQALLEAGPFVGVEAATPGRNVSQPGRNPSGVQAREPADKSDATPPPDPAKVIDWLLQQKAGQPEEE